MFVIDASVAVKWFIEEKDSATSLGLKENHINGKTILIAPDLLIYEVANVLLFSRLFELPDIKKFLQDLYDLEIDLISPSSDIMLSAAEIACNKNISIYDASYLAIAKEFDITFITADEKLYNSVKELHCVQLLSNI